MLVVDSHCHLNFPDFSEDLDEVVARAREGGVGVMQTICTKLSEFDDVHAITMRYDDVYCSVGVHPHEADHSPLTSPDALIELTKRDKVIGIGETGLDYYYEHSKREAQQESFLYHIEAARQTGLPLIVHTRDADEDTVSMLTQEMKKGAFTGVIHCFSSTQYLADKCLELGFYISLSGIITFKKAEELRGIVEGLPLERILVETDAPYLAPVPLRGKRNEPYNTIYTNRLLSEIKKIDEGEMAHITSNNFFRLFDRALKPESEKVM